MNQIDTLSVNAIRILSADAIQNIRWKIKKTF